MIEEFRSEGGSRGGVVLVHGFTGSPEEMRPLLAPLAERSWSVLGVRLPGHGFPPTPERAEWPAWEARLDGALDELRARFPGRRTAICGLSAGALLALRAACRRPTDVGALVALSPAIELPAAAKRILWLARRLLPGPLRRLRIPKRSTDIRDAEARRRAPGCDPLPISSFLSFDELRRRAREVVATVAQPTLIVHARGDATCPVAGAEWLRSRIGAREVEMHLLARSGHVVTVDEERDAVAGLVVDFLERRVAAAG